MWHTDGYTRISSGLLGLRLLTNHSPSGQQGTDFSQLPVHVMCYRHTHAGLSKYNAKENCSHQILWFYGLFIAHRGSRWCLLTSYKTTGNSVTLRTHEYRGSLSKQKLISGDTNAPGMHEYCVVLSLLLNADSF